jgi:hypothetical protein
MAIPSEYNDHPTTIGATNMKTPVKNISCYPVRLNEESIGPLTNLKTGTVLHPDMYDSSPDRGRVNAAQHEKQMSSWIPGELAGSNMVQKGDDTTRTVEVQGEQATYMETLLAQSPNA